MCSFEQYLLTAFVGSRIRDETEMQVIFVNGKTNYEKCNNNLYLFQDTIHTIHARFVWKISHPKDPKTNEK